jgi:phage terminase large subunit
MSDWPPDYSFEFSKRAKRIKKMYADPSYVKGAKEFYKTHPIEFIEDWCCTYDPRNATRKLPTTMPFILFPRQHDFINFLHDCLKNEEHGLVEKARDMGATWLSSAFTVWIFLFYDGASIGWGSRKEMYVDSLGSLDSIFEKIRMLIKTLPPFLRPKGYDPKKHAPYMRIINPETGAMITGEAGDNIGRGGRNLIYFKDESAWFTHPELIEAALGDNTDVQIDISSVHGTGNVYHNKRVQGEIWTPEHTLESGKTRVFILDWKDHPSKNQEWYDKRRAKAESEGLLHLFNQEVDRDYSGAIENVVIPQEWVKAAIDADKKLKLDTKGRVFGGLDVADEGGDLNAFAAREGLKLVFVDKWGEGDTFQTAQKALNYSIKHKVTNLGYDCIGVGAGVKAAFNRSKSDGKIPSKLDIKAWNAAASPFNPTKRIIANDKESMTNKEFYSNLKAQAWWELRRRFERTYQAVQSGVVDKPDDLIVIDGSLEYIHELTSELSRPVFAYDGRGKITIDKKPNGAKSPNMADAIVMAYWPKLTGGFFVS